MRLLLCLLLLSLMLSCGDAIFYSDTKRINEETWKYNDKLKFVWQVKDTNKVFDLLLHIKHKFNYDYQNTYVRFVTGFPDSTTKEQIISLELFNPAGRPNGICKGEFCETIIPLGQHLNFPKMGEYFIEVNQFSRDSLLKGIAELSLRIENVKD